MTVEPSNSSKEWAIEQSRIDLADHARAYTRKKWAVVPLWWPMFPLVCACRLRHECKSPGKHPMKTDWAAEPLRDGLQTDLWWARHPNCNVGIATGATSGFVVLDIDPDHGGWDSYNHIVKRYGRLPETLVSVTGSGGRHVLFRHPGDGQTVKNAIGYLPGIDVRGDGGQIVVPPSIHGSGARYIWHPQGHPARVQLADMPEWMFALLEIKEQKHRAKNHQRNGRSKYGRLLDLKNLPTIAEGHRNDELCSIVGRLIWENRDEQEVADLARSINAERCTPPLPDKEVDGLVRSAIKRWA